MRRAGIHSWAARLVLPPREHAHVRIRQSVGQVDRGHEQIRRTQQEQCPVGDCAARIPDDQEQRKRDGDRGELDDRVEQQVVDLADRQQTQQPCCAKHQCRYKITITLPLQEVHETHYGSPSGNAFSERASDPLPTCTFTVLSVRNG